MLFPQTPGRLKILLNLWSRSYFRYETVLNSRTNKIPTLGHTCTQRTVGTSAVKYLKGEIYTNNPSFFADVCEQCYFESIIPAAFSFVSALEEVEKRPFLAKARSSPDERSPEDSSNATSGLKHSSERSPQVPPTTYESRLHTLEQEEMACAPAEDEIEKKSHEEEVQTTPISQDRSLQLAVLQTRPFKETLTLLDVDNQQEGSKSQAQVMKRKSNLKASWMTEKTSVDLSSTGQEVKHKTKIVHFYSFHKNPNAKNNSVSPQIGNQEDTTGRPIEKDMPSQMENDTMKDDETYRANPVFIYEDDALLATELKITEPEDSQGTSGHFMDKKLSSPEEALSSSIFTNNPVFSENTVTSGEEVDQNNTKERPRPDGSQVSSFRCGEVQERDAKADTEQSPNFSEWQIPKSKDNFEKIRKSPSKTYPPNDLPQESSCAKEFRLRESPLKTFPIDIVPEVKVAQEPQQKIKSESRQMESFSPVRKQRELPNTNTDEGMSSSSPVAKQSRDRVTRCLL